MIGKASEVKVKQMFGRIIPNPHYEKGTNGERYIDIPLEDDVNEFLQSLGHSIIVSIQYQMSVHENIADSVLIIYKEESA